MKKSVLTRILTLVSTIFFLFVSLGMTKGTVQDYIYFAGVANEMAFTLMTIGLTGIFALLTVAD